MTVWPEPPPLDDRCRCGHHEDSHGPTILGEHAGRCSSLYYGDTCYCTRYVNRQQWTAQRREERFWSRVGNHPLD